MAHGEGGTTVPRSLDAAFAYNVETPSRCVAALGKWWSRSREECNGEQADVLLDTKTQPLLQVIRTRKYKGDEMIAMSILTDEQRSAHGPSIQRKVRGMDPFHSKQESRAVALVLGMACGDALGHTLEFFPVKYDRQERLIDEMKGGGKFMLKPGQWTDDTSMGLCLADSLLCANNGRKSFDPLDLMLRFEAWWAFGYNNAFALDEERQEKHSVGLGGNISQALQRFLTKGEAQTKAGDRNTSGNGSMMRLAPVSCAFFRTPGVAMEIARKSSLTTHQGEEAAECARLLSYICTLAINSGDDEPDACRILDAVQQTFSSSEPSVMSLARGEAEPSGDSDRNWEWRRTDFRYAPGRAAMNPGYVGSYAMDGLAMALHCVYITTSFKEAVLTCVNMGGDADTVGSITGQIAGAIYGCEGIPQRWLQDLERWDNGGDIAIKASLLYNLYK